MSTFEQELGKALQEMHNNPLWYLPDTPAGKFIDRYILGDDDQSLDFQKYRHLFIEAVARELYDGFIKLGRRDEYFNDDDRIDITKEDLPMLVDLENIVVHHTATFPLASASYIEALQMMRIYVPLHRNNSFFKNNGSHLPLSSGHRYGMRDTFIAYHALVWRYGSRSRYLNYQRHVGLHAGNFDMNVKSIAVSYVDDLSESRPTWEGLNTLAELIRTLMDEFFPDKDPHEVVIGHKDVPNLAKPTICPGGNWHEWREDLLRLIEVE